MLETIRNHAKGWIAKVILGLIAVTFALFGVDSYMQGGGGEDVIASVGNTKISRQEFTRELQDKTDQLREAMGEKYDRTTTETPEFRKRVLDNLLDRKALLLAAQQQGFQLNDQYFKSALSSISAFEENGAFSQQRFEATLRQRDMTPASFENEVRNTYMLETQTSPVLFGTFTSSTSLSQMARILTQQREISVAMLAPAEAATQVKISEDDIKNYYASHRAEFTEPEKIRAEYLTLNIDAAMAEIPVSEKEITDYYQANAARLAQPEQRSASHVLLSVPKGANVAAKAELRAKAAQLTSELQKIPARFAEVARKESQDPGSAAQGGSLGSFGRGAMVKAFDEAVFGMKKSEIRGPVESEFGFHIIRLDDIQPATAVPLENVRAEITTGLRKQKVQIKFSELAESFSNLVYEKADSLKPAADALKLTIQTSDWMSKKSAPAPFLKTKLGEVLFSADAIQSKQNTEAIEVAPGVLVAARVLEHRPAAVKGLNEVRAVIEQSLRNERTAKLLTARGEGFLGQLRQGKEPGLRWSEFKTVNRQQSLGLDAASMKAIFSADTRKLPAYTGLMGPDGSYRIVRISRVLESPAPDPALLGSVKKGVQEALERADLQAMIQLAKSSHKVEVRENALEVNK